MVFVHHHQARVVAVLAFVLAGKELNRALLVRDDDGVLVYLAPLQQAGAGFDVPRARREQEARLLPIPGGDENLAAGLAEEALVGADHGAHRRLAHLPRQSQQAPLVLPPAVRPLRVEEAVEVLVLPGSRDERLAGERGLRMLQQPRELADVNPSLRRQRGRPRGR